MRERVKSSVGARTPPFREHYGFFISIVVTGEKYFLKIKFTFMLKNVPTVESNCCVSDEHEFDFM